MKDFLIKMAAAICFIVGMGLMMGAADRCSVIEGIAGLSIFAMLVPISKCDTFKDEDERI